MHWGIEPLAEICDIKPQKSEARQRVGLNTLVSFAPMEALGIDRKFLIPSQTKPLADVVASYTYFAEGDVLLAKITPCFENGKLGIATGLSNGIGFGSSEFMVFRPSARLDKGFLYYFLMRPEFRAEGAARLGGAVGQQRVPREFIESYQIPVPPLPEQQRIVDILDEAFAGLAIAKANAEKNLQNARALFESHLESVFTHRGEKWDYERLGNLCSIGDGNYSSKYPKASEFLSQGVPFLTAANLKSGTIVPEGLRFISTEQHMQLSKGHVKTGDLVVVVRGSNTGDSSFVPERFDGANLNSQLVYLRPKERVINKFLFFSFNSPQTQVRIEREISGAAQPQLPNNKLLDIQVGFPSVPEQAAIVKRLDFLIDQTRHLAAIYDRKLAALEELKRSLLHHAFSGKL